MTEQAPIPPRACIASTGRAGSGWIAKVLQAYGIQAGHEQYWRFPWQQPQQVEIDSSWLSVPHLSDYEGIVFHQVRSPLAVLTSLLDTYSKDTAHAKKYFPFRKQVMPQQTGNLERDFMAMICSMNKDMEKHAVYRWRIEDFNRNDIERICRDAGYGYNKFFADDAIEAVSTQYNNHTDKPCLTWEELPECKWKDKLRDQAYIYGY